MSFELNIAVLPNHILYIKGMSVAYIKVYVQIYSLWNSGKTCFLGNDEFCKRTGLDERTIRRAIEFLGKNNLLIKRIIDGKRTLIQPEKMLITDEDITGLQRAELPGKAGGVAREGGQSRPHNIKIEIKKEKKRDFFKKNNINGAKKELKPRCKHGQIVGECSSGDCFIPSRTGKIINVKELIKQVLYKTGEN